MIKLDHEINMIPNWLLQNENYQAIEDKSGYLNKTILALIALLARIRNNGSVVYDQFRVNPFLKVVSLLLFILLVSLAHNLLFVLMSDILLLIFLSLLNGEVIIKILKVVLSVLIFTFLIMLPSALMVGLAPSIMILAKIFATVVAGLLLANTTKWSHITSALRVFYIPDIFVLILDIAIKYIVILGELALDLLYALKLRSVGYNSHKTASLSAIVGNLFIKSQDMAEEMHFAMQCRGFVGEYKIQQQTQFTWRDVLLIIINLVLIGLFVMYGLGL